MKILIPVDWIERNKCHYLCIQSDTDQSILAIEKGWYYIYDGVDYEAKIVEEGSLKGVEMDHKLYCEEMLAKHAFIGFQK